MRGNNETVGDIGKEWRKGGRKDKEMYIHINYIQQREEERRRERERNEIDRIDRRKRTWSETRKGKKINKTKECKEKKNKTKEKQCNKKQRRKKRTKVIKTTKSEERKNSKIATHWFPEAVFLKIYFCYKLFCGEIWFAVSDLLAIIFVQWHFSVNKLLF